MNANDVIAHSLSASGQLLKRYVGDLTPPEYLHRANPKGNCTAWIIGHLTLSDRRVLGMLGASDLPILPEGFETRFSREGNAPFATDFGDVTTLMTIFDQNHQRLIDTVKHASAELIDKPLEKPHPMFGTVGQMANFMALHTAMHAGQITMIRRSLGKPPMF